jgi:hypothetical protein
MEMDYPDGTPFASTYNGFKANPKQGGAVPPDWGQNRSSWSDTASKANDAIDLLSKGLCLINPHRAGCSRPAVNNQQFSMQNQNTWLILFVVILTLILLVVIIKKK